MLRELIGFLVQLLIAVYIFCRKQTKRNFFLIRILLGSFVIILLCSINRAFVNTVFLQYRQWYGTCKYIIVFCMVTVLLLYCFKIKMQEALFFAGSGYALQNMAHYIYAILHILFLEGNQVNSLLEKTMEALCFAAIYIMAYVFTKNLVIKENKGIAGKKIVGMSVLIILFAIVLSDQIPVGSIKYTIYYLYDILSMLVVLFLQYGMVENNTLQRENEMIQQMLYMKQEQHKIAEDTVALINMKCHDLKHQLHILKENGRVDQAVVKDIKDSIEMYDSMIETGNDALNIILTEKSFHCVQNNIKFTYLIDGKMIQFMDTADIYSFFGNALENAIEAMQAEKEEKRYIYLKAAKRGDLICIHIENYCCTEPVFKDGLPVTTKTKEKGYHGFGVKSIRYITEKYGGFTQMTWDHNIFSLNAFFNPERK